MSQRGGGKRNKLRGGPPPRDHNRSVKNKQQQQSSVAYHDDQRREGPGEPVGEAKIEDKSHKEVCIGETADKQDAQEDVGPKQPETVTLDFTCNKSGCVNRESQYQKLLVEREQHLEIIRELREEVQRLTAKNYQNIAPQQIMEVDTSTNHMIASRDTSEHVAGPSLGNSFDKSSKLAENSHKLRRKEVKEESRNQKDKSLEQVTTKNWADDSVAEEEKHFDPAWPAHGAGSKQSSDVQTQQNASWNDSTDVRTQNSSWYNSTDVRTQQNSSWYDSTDVQIQQNASWNDVPADETKKNRPPVLQQTNRGDAPESFNITHGCSEQNRSVTRRNIDPNARQPGGSNRSGSRDHKSWHGGVNRHYVERQQHEYGQSQGKERGNWRNNQAGDQPVKHNKVLKEIEGDLFTAPKTCSLAHCVAEDMRMGSGIAVTFRQTFKQVDELLAQEARTGEVAVLKNEDRFIYYLVTKRLSHGKPQLEHLRSSLIKMKEHILANNVHDVAMPKIGCGLDRLNWWDVRSLLIEIFGENDVNITVYTFNQEQGESNQPRSLLRINHAGYSLQNIDYGTGLLYLGSEDGAVSESLQSLLVKFPILQQYKQATRCVGQYIRTECKNEVLYGLIMKKNGNDKFSFTTFSKCLKSLRNVIKKDRYKYAGIDVVSISDDPELDTEKLITMFKNAWFNSCVDRNMDRYMDLYICWPEKYISVYKECYEESQKFRKQQL